MSTRDVTVQTPRGNERTGAVIARRPIPGPQTLEYEYLVDLGGVRLWCSETDLDAP